MPKNLLMVIGLGAGLWAIMFLGVFALIISPLPELVQKIAEIILAGVAAFILPKFYFKKNSSKIKDGVILWVAWLVIITILDLLITVWFVKGFGSYVSGLKIFYGMWSLWVSFFVMLSTIILASKTTPGGDLIKKPTTQAPVVLPTQNPPQKPLV